MTALDEARMAAAAAADRAGVRVVDGDALTVEDLVAVADLFDVVWGGGGPSRRVIGHELLVAFVHAGSQVSVAWRGDELVGGSAAFLGRDNDGPTLHSHLTGIRESATGHGIGTALKLHQRAWALARDIHRVVWTFDPLVRRNAVFNLVTLGARAVRYERDRYGRMADTRNRDTPTDRFVVHWDLTSPRATAAATGRRVAPEPEGLRRAGATEVLRIGVGDHPEIAVPPEPPASSPLWLAQTPTDIEALRGSDPATALAWTEAARATIAAALGAGARVTGITRDGWYVLDRRGGVEELAG